MSKKSAEKIWAEAVKETGVWLSPFAEQLAEFGRLVIPRYRAALDAEFQRGVEETLAALDASSRPADDPC